MKEFGIFKTGFFVAMAAFLSAHGQVRQSSSSALFNPGGYRLGVGDEVEIQVFGEPEVTTHAKINRDGMVRLVYISAEIPIRGLTIKEVEKFIAEQYYKNRIFRNAIVRVNITKYIAKEILFTGKFAKTGPFVFPPEVEAMDIVDVVTRNGGFQEIAKSTEVKVTRTIHAKDGSSTKETYTVNVKAKMEGNTETERFMVYPGDILFVREKLI
ncbi:MAG: hypothetical protein CMJ96_04560 [Planctomycetes bacterium]|nr:hypothetical protein [Planctomycetota bacterium]